MNTENQPPNHEDAGRAMANALGDAINLAATMAKQSKTRTTVYLAIDADGNGFADAHFLGGMNIKMNIVNNDPSGIVRAPATAITDLENVRRNGQRFSAPPDLS